MEIVVNLSTGRVTIDGEEACICATEKYYGNPAPELGKHWGCVNFVRVFITVLSVNQTHGVEVQEVRIFPEIHTRDWHGMTQRDDRTLVEYWTDVCIQKTTWFNISKGNQVYCQLRDSKAFDLHALWLQNTGKNCRGMDLKFVPEFRRDPGPLDEATKKMVMDYVHNLDMDEVHKKYAEQQASQQAFAVNIVKVPPSNASPVPDGSPVLTLTGHPVVSEARPETVSDPVPAGSPVLNRAARRAAKAVVIRDAKDLVPTGPAASSTPGSEPVAEAAPGAVPGDAVTPNPVRSASPVSPASFSPDPSCPALLGSLNTSEK